MKKHRRNTLRRRLVGYLLIVGLLSLARLNAQPLHSRWDELTASDWPGALAASSHTCVPPIGILEKHGPHVPVGSILSRCGNGRRGGCDPDHIVSIAHALYTGGSAKSSRVCAGNR